MKYFHLLLCLLFVSTFSMAQLQRVSLPDHLDEPAFRIPVADFARQTGNTVGPEVEVPRSLNFLAPEVNIGVTTYDLQSNASVSSRFLVEPSGKRTAVWMQSRAVDDINDDRGTGLNIYEGGWQEMPDERIESVRTGWPSLVQLGDGTYVVSSHTVDNTINLANSADGSSWSESILPTNVSFGLLWPRLASGGPDGMSLHAIALTAPDDNLNPQEYLGVDGHLLYYRSLDGGQTWDKIDQVLPGLDSTSYAFLSADTYSVHARENVVAILLYGEWGDLSLFKSEDNGETWERTIINDFPLDGYSIDDGYTIEDIEFDEFAPDSLAIYTTSGEGDAIIDNNGMVHVTYAESYVMDNDTSDDASSYYPGWSGIAYWNESFSGEPLLIGGLIDYNDNDTIDIAGDEIPRYVNSTATNTPTMAMDVGGGIYVCYAAVSEEHFNEQDEQHYRHLLAVRSNDGGNNWGPMIDLINDDLVDPEFNDFLETVYPVTAEMVDDTFHVIYQQDFFPGHRFTDEQDPLIDNFIVYLAVPADYVPDETVSSAVDFTNEVGITAYPTITEGMIQFRSEEVIQGKVSLEVYDMVGRRHIVQSHTQLPDGIDLTTISTGSYILIIRTEQGNAVQRIFKK